MSIQTQGTADELNQRDRNGVSGLPGMAGLMDQMRCNGTVNDAPHPGYEFFRAGGADSDTRQRPCRDILP